MPSAPTDLIAAASGHDRIDLNWTDNSDNETEFKIERRMIDSNFDSIAVVEANITAYQDTGLEANKTYIYRVAALNGVIMSEYSNEATATTYIENSPPRAENLSITGIAKVGELVTGNYSYFDDDGDEEGESIYQWLRKVDEDFIPILDATQKTYTLVSADIDALIRFQVTPIAQTGVLRGDVAVSEPFGPIEKIVDDFSITFYNYPNPLRNNKTTLKVKLGQPGNIVINIYDANGELVQRFKNNLQGQMEYSVEWQGRDFNDMTLANGVYIGEVVANFNGEEKRQYHKIAVFN